MGRKWALCNVKYDFKVSALTGQQSRAVRGTTPAWLKWFSLKKKIKIKNNKKSHCEGQQRDEMLTVSCYIALRSPESAAKTAVLMENMTDAFFSNTVPLVSITFNWRMAGILAPPTGRPKWFNVCTFYVKYKEWEQRGNFFMAESVSKS